MHSTPTTRVAIVLGAVFLLLAALHVFWALTAVPQGVRPTLADEPLAQPPVPLTLGVAVALVAAAALVLLRAGLLPPRIPSWLSRTGCWVLGGVFVLRAMGEFRFVGFLKTVRDTRFAVWDTWLFSPICLLLGLGVLWLAAGRRAPGGGRPADP